MFYIPGKHDVADADNGKAYLERYGKNTEGKGWYSFDTAGVHFIGLINVFDFQPGFKSAGLANLGDEQLEWLEKDIADRSASTPFVLMAHLPLWTIYEPWGWGTADAGSTAFRSRARWYQNDARSGSPRRPRRPTRSRNA